MPTEKVLLYTNRSNEIEEYARLIQKAVAPEDLMVCSNSIELNRAIPEAEIVFGVHLPLDAYSRATKLKWVQSMWAGVEGLLQAELPEGTLISKPWGVFGRYLSQYVFAYLLSKKVRLLEALEAQKKRSWSPYALELLQGQCLGLAGMGDIAADIARVGRAFGMTIWGLNSNGHPHPLADRIFATRERAEFVSGADVLVLTLPATESTRAMFNRELLSCMQKHAIIINVGRGALIDDQALLEMLASQKIAGVVLDVFKEEPLPEEHPYWSLPNCIVTPHIGGPSLPSEITDCFLENLRRYRNGEQLLGLVDLRRGY